MALVGLKAERPLISNYFFGGPSSMPDSGPSALPLLRPRRASRNR